MAPTRGHHEEIEGRYKAYAYSPVPVSSSSAVYSSTTLGRRPGESGFNSAKYYSLNGAHDEYRYSDMTEKGSTTLQYVAASAGKCNPTTVARRTPPLCRGGNGYTCNPRRSAPWEPVGREFRRVPGGRLGEVPRTRAPASRSSPWQAFGGSIFRWPRSGGSLTRARGIRGFGVAVEG